MSNLAANLIRSAERSANRVAIALDDAELTTPKWSMRRSWRSACSPSTGCIGGDRVGIMVPNVLSGQCCTTAPYEPGPWQSP